MSNQPMRLPTEVPPEAFADDGETRHISDPETMALAQQAVAAANEAPEDTSFDGAPLLPIPNRDALHVDLAVGSFNPITRTEYTTAEVRELTGEDEEYFFRGKTFHERKTRLIESGTVSLSGEEATPELLSTLAAGDHEVLLLAIRRATYGDILELELTCPRCGEEQGSEINLAEDVPIKSYDALRHEFTLKSGKTVVFHWPTGEDDRALWEFAEANKQATIAELNTQMIARVVEQIDGDPSFGVQTAKSMNMRDRRDLIDYIAGNVPGPQYRELKHRCANTSCEFVADLEVSFEDLFR